MSSADSTRPLLTAPLSRILGWGVLFLLLLAGCFTFPNPPSTGLDPSWRMALGYFYENGMQFGRDVVFTYGPLGFVMGKTFFGLQFWPLITGQLILAFVSTVTILLQGRRLEGRSRMIYFIFMLVFGVGYEDALHMLVIAILGFELIRLIDEPRRMRLILIAAVLAGYAQIKFTDLLLATFGVIVASAYGFSRRRRGEAIVLVLAFAGVFIGIWMICGQALGNLPAFFRGSWEISAGYQWAMGFPTPSSPLWKGVLILLLLVGYSVMHVVIHPNKLRAVANTLFLGVFVYLNWKHGFVRADGHMLGFFYCALLPLTAYPFLLDDPNKFRFQHRWAFAIAIFVCIWGLETALGNSVRTALGSAETKIWDNIVKVVRWDETRQSYRDELTLARMGSDLHEVRSVVGNASIDVIGCEQSAVFFNRFNYRPRPLIQGYSTFTPYLAQLNGDFYASDRAPDYVLVKLETIDGRLLTMDDAQVLVILPYRYDYVLTDRGFQLWKRKAATFDASTVIPKPIRTETATVNRPLVVADLAGKPIWVKIDLQPSFLGKIRSFLYKPPQVKLRVEDTSGNTTAGGAWDYLMPLPEGRNGFILNPVIGDVVEYMHYASNTPLRWTRAITVKVAESDMKYFAPQASVELSALPPPASSAEAFFPKGIDKLFKMFKTRPITFESHIAYTEANIDGKLVAIMHAPSQMIFDVPKGARTLSGSFGYMAEAYTGNARTNGARFIIYWSNGSKRIDLLQKFLNPLTVAEDRGLHNFSVSLENISGGHLYLEVDPGPFHDIGWDWTGWTDISISE